MTEPRAVLDEVAALAGGDGTTRGFLDALAAAPDRGVLVVTPHPGRQHAEEFAAWVRQLGDGDPVRVATVDEVGTDPAALLPPAKVVVVLPYGRLLAPEDVACAAAALDRPPGTAFLVLVGAEGLADPDDAEVTRRGVWRMLVGDPDVSWQGQDLTARRCLTWSPSAAGGAEHDELRRWLRPAAPEPELDRLRARHAVDILEDELPTSSATDRRAVAANRSAIRRAASTLRRRVLDLVDADAGVLDMRVDTSLQTLEHELRAGLEGRLADAGRAGSPAIAEIASQYVTQAVDRWARETEALVAASWRRTHEKALDLATGPDERRLAAALPPTAPTTRDVVDAIVAGADLHLASIPASEVGAGRVAAGAARGTSWQPALRGLGYGGAAAVASLALVGVGVAAVALTALGTVGGLVADERVTDARRRDAARDALDRAVQLAVAEYATAARGEVSAHTTALRNRVEASCSALTSALETARREPDPADRRHRRLRELRTSLLPSSSTPAAAVPGPEGT